MRTSILNIEFNFAKSINLSLIAAPAITDIEGIEQTTIEYYTWDEKKDGPIPGIKLFKDLNIFLEREFCEY